MLDCCWSRASFQYYLLSDCTNFLTAELVGEVKGKSTAAPVFHLLPGQSLDVQRVFAKVIYLFMGIKSQHETTLCWCWYTGI